MKIVRVFSEKRPEFAVEAKGVLNDLTENLMISGLQDVRILVRYDVQGIDEEIFKKAQNTIFSEPQVDTLSFEEADFAGYKVFAVEYLTGQFDQRADSAAQCIQILTGQAKPDVKVAKVYAVNDAVSDTDIEKIKQYVINPVDSREAGLKKPDSLDMQLSTPDKVKVFDGFIQLDEDGLFAFLKENGFACDLNDIKFCQEYFRDVEKRDPTVTEMKMIDTYWSDHCRHTTFSTNLTGVEIEDPVIKKVYDEYLESRKFVYRDKKEKPVCLMDLATIAMKELKKKGVLDNLDESEEINACSIEVEVDVNGKPETWLVMFKNETHNHPTEIEPFGGAATCLGGAIRDPLSGRSYVYQAMRVTGSGDPRKTVEETLKGKLPQRKISTVAAHGYSSYGNQIGLSTGLVREIYDESYIAKRMEIGAVVGAAPKENVIRTEPQPGDLIVLLGGRTGRDGCGGATGSSKAHTEQSIETCGAEVQKGNPPEERKIQRLFRKKEVTNLIKRCNDFGAGGVSVAIGELADGLVINLDKVPKKYAGLDGTELAISESQERMAVVVAKENAERFVREAAKENLEANVVAEVTAENRLKMFWQDDCIVDISREFLNSNGAPKYAEARIPFCDRTNLFQSVTAGDGSFAEKFKEILSNLNVCSQKGLGEMFDGTIGASSVLMPFGGKYELTPAEAMAAKIPVQNGETKTATVMAYGYDPKLAEKSPFYSALYAVIQSVAKVVASGCDVDEIYLTFQEYFERLGEDALRWGKPLSALLGAYLAQKELNMAAIGGKDSMSGSFNNLDVVPTLVSFAIAPANTDDIISPEFKNTDSKAVYLPVKRDENGMPDFKAFLETSRKLYRLIVEKKVTAAYAVPMGGIAEAVLKMAFGNKIGFAFEKTEGLFEANYGGYILETAKDFEMEGAEIIGFTNDSRIISIGEEIISLEELILAFTKPLSKVYPETHKADKKTFEMPYYTKDSASASKYKTAKPKVLIPVFPGTNCEYDTERQFRFAGAETKILVFRNTYGNDIAESLEAMEKEIRSSQMMMLPGGFSGGDEPDGSGKFIATVLRNPRITDAIHDMLYQRDGLMLGICNGFQALIKLGLVPFGKIIDTNEECPTLTYNTIGRHISTMVNVKVMSNLSPWFSHVKPGEVYKVPVSHGEGRFVASEKMIEELKRNGQIATCYAAPDGQITDDPTYNVNGSYCAIEGITSPDGRVLGKMGHSERIGDNLYKNIPGEFDMQIFKSGVEYFK